MKQFFLPMLALAMLTSCSKNENISDGNDGAPVAIRLGAGVEMSTKAPVSGSASVQIEGWETTGTVSYAGASTWQSDATVSVSATAASITLSPVRYYNADENTTTYMKGWYPNVTSSNGTVTFSNTTGTEDVLLSNAVSGKKKAPVASDMIFEHQTAQLVFKVVKGTGLASGTKIKSIKVKNAKVPTAITLATNVVTYTSKGDLSVPNITVAEITSPAALAGDPLMIEPVVNNTTLKLDIETVKADGTTAAATYTDVTFATDGSKLVKGTAYTVTLTFNQADVSVKAAITPWASAAGSGTVL